MPALGFGTLIPDPAETRSATTNALKVGFRHFDCAERYRNEWEVGESLKSEFATGAITRQDVFITTKLWNTNHRPERVEPAFNASCECLGISYVDLYLIHTPYAFQPGDNMEPRDQMGHIIYDHDVTLLDTWRAMENLVEVLGRFSVCCADLPGVTIWRSFRGFEMEFGKRILGLDGVSHHRS